MIDHVEVIDAVEALTMAGQALDLARSAVSKAARVLESLLDASGTDDSVEIPPPLIATDDLATCDHPVTFDLPGQTMCQSCGASRTEDGTWKVL